MSSRDGDRALGLALQVRIISDDFIASLRDRRVPSEETVAAAKRICFQNKDPFSDPDWYSVYNDLLQRVMDSFDRHQMPQPTEEDFEKILAGGIAWKEKEKTMRKLMEFLYVLENHADHYFRYDE
jgi:hypothetical protein